MKSEKGGGRNIPEEFCSGLLSSKWSARPYWEARKSLVFIKALGYHPMWSHPICGAPGPGELRSSYSWWNSSENVWNGALRLETQCSKVAASTLRMPWSSPSLYKARSQIMTGRRCDGQFLINSDREWGSLRTAKVPSTSSSQ